MVKYDQQQYQEKKDELPTLCFASYEPLLSLNPGNMNNRYRKADAYEVTNSLTGEAFDPAKPIYIASLKNGSGSSDGTFICISEEQLNSE